MTLGLYVKHIGSSYLCMLKIQVFLRYTLKAQSKKKKQTNCNLSIIKIINFYHRLGENICRTSDEGLISKIYILFLKKIFYSFI